MEYAQTARQMASYFKGIVEALGINLTLLFFVVVMGVSLSFVYNGTNPPDTRTANYAINFTVLCVVSMGAAFVNKAMGGNWFRGAEYAANESLSVKKFPALALIYFIVFSILGYLFVEIVGFAINGFNRPNSVYATPDFIFQNIFSPISEEYFWRGLLQPLLEMVFAYLFALFGREATLATKIIGILISGVLQGIMFALVHISAFSNNPSVPLDVAFFQSVLFGILMAALSSAFGIIAPIAWHMGSNLNTTAALASAPLPLMLPG